VAAESPGGRALDLGCGTGVVTVALARRGFRATGVDHSPEMLALAQAKLEREGVSADLELADVRALRFRDGEFDCVTCQGLLHHLEEPAGCLKELERVLRPGGAFYLSEPTRDVTPVRRALLVLWRLLPRPRRPQVPAPMTVEEPVDPDGLRATLDRLGLEYEVEFLTHIPPLRRHLPDRVYLVASRVLTFPWRRRKGDLVFVFGRKRSG
jgi:2-polyprenyl-3-methyl-5-hydroxy-6-metoxy-1,4-benzoquinol methylase